MKEEHLPVDGPRYVTKEALTEMVEGKQPRPFGGFQAEKEKPKTPAELLLDEMRRQAEK
jgi:hypothetical protein